MPGAPLLRAPKLTGSRGSPENTLHVHRSHHGPVSAGVSRVSGSLLLMEIWDREESTLVWKTFTVVRDLFRRRLGPQPGRERFRDRTSTKLR